jgi:uncharacterized protein involved in copper resistance
MVEMGVRDEDPVDVAGVDGRVAPEMPDPPSQHRVGDQARTVDIDHDSAVPQPGELAQTMSSPIEYPAAATFITPFG